MDANQLARSKYNNFIQRHFTYLQAMQFTDEQLATDWNTIAAHITLAYMFRPLVDDEDEEALVAMLRASDLPNKDDILRVWDAMEHQAKLRVWRYLKFFFNTVLC
jgi:hypothetical protein